jgi:hypothetical protein
MPYFSTIISSFYSTKWSSNEHPNNNTKSATHRTTINTSIAISYGPVNFFTVSAAISATLYLSFFSTLT